MPETKPEASFSCVFFGVLLLIAWIGGSWIACMAGGVIAFSGHILCGVALVLTGLCGFAALIASGSGGSNAE